VPKNVFIKPKHVSYVSEKEHKLCFFYDLVLFASVDIFLKESNLMNTYWRGHTMEVIKTTPYYKSKTTTYS